MRRCSPNVMARRKALWVDIPNGIKPHEMTVALHNPATPEESEHRRLVAQAAHWLERRCSVVVTEIATTGEEPDAIGWTGTHSILLECKASIEDFRRDQQKSFRTLTEMGIGQYRYFFAPRGVIPVLAMPTKWGLIEVGGRRQPKIVIPAGQFDDFNHRQEMRILLSVIRRIGKHAPTGVSVRCYNYETKNRASLRVEKESPCS